MTTLTRRQLTKTAAWSVPVIAVAAATPAAAASTTAPAFDAQVVGFCQSTGASGAVYAAFQISATTQEPIPAGQLVTITMDDETNGGQLTTDSVTTSTEGGTAGISGISVSADKTTWTATTTREISADDMLNLYIIGVGFSTNGETAVCTIAANDTDTSNNTSTITRVGIFDGLCQVS